MIRHICVFILAAIFSVGLWAQEFEINSDTGLGVASAPGEPFSLSQRLGGTYNVPFDLQGGGFTFKAHVAAGVPVNFSADIDQLSVAFAYQAPALDLKELTLTLGRVPLSDPTGMILNHPGDGLQLAFDFNGLNLNIATAYTGFVLRSSSGLSLTLADQAGSEGLFASPRFIGSVEGALTLFGSHRFSLSALAQQDMHKRSDLTEEWGTVFDAEKGGALDTQYITLHADGPVAQRLFYETFATFGSGSTLSWIQDESSPTGYQYEYKPIVSFLTGGELTYFLPDFFSSSFRGRVLVASGDGDASTAVEGNTKDWSTLFVPVTGTGLGLVFNPALSNLVSYELGATAKPLPELPLTANAKILAFQRATAGVVNAPGVLRKGPVWMGEEVDLIVTWKPLSDLSTSVSLGAFLPSSGTYASGAGASFQYAAKVGVNLSL